MAVSSLQRNTWQSLLYTRETHGSLLSTPVRHMAVSSLHHLGRGGAEAFTQKDSCLGPHPNIHGGRELPAYLVPGLGGRKLPVFRVAGLTLRELPESRAAGLGGRLLTSNVAGLVSQNGQH